MDTHAVGMDIYIKKKKKEKNLYRLHTETRKYCIKAKTELWTGTAEGLLYLDKGIAGGRVCGSITAKRVFGLLQTVTILNFAVARNSGFSVETICVHIYIYTLQINGGMPAAGRPSRTTAAVAPQNFTHIYLI